MCTKKLCVSSRHIAYVIHCEPVCTAYERMRAHTRMEHLPFPRRRVGRVARHYSVEFPCCRTHRGREREREQKRESENERATERTIECDSERERRQERERRE